MTRPQTAKPGTVGLPLFLPSLSLACLASCDITRKVCIGIEEVDTSLPELINDLLKPFAPDARSTATYHDIRVSCSLYVNGSLVDVPQNTMFKSFNEHEKYSIKEWFQFPTNYRDLTLSSQFLFIVWGLAGPHTVVPLGGSFLDLFNRHELLRKGHKRISLFLFPPLLSASFGGEPVAPITPDRQDGLEKRQDFPLVPWLDKQLSVAMEHISQCEAQHPTARMTLSVMLPYFPFPVRYLEKVGAWYIAPRPDSIVNHIWDGETSPALRSLTDLHHSSMLRSSAQSAPEVKPNQEEARQLGLIVVKPVTDELASDEKELLWRLRYACSRDHLV
ncbi:putative atypical PIKK PI3K protein kinase [Paratrimastix pyriformis]|uniref:Atypical PIKK PI3K protein kinase n=1 Tax=Paratrimastix pyriformis TaxID=342808 RepID=A0ABQ8UG45_9EUKA|nr:putative atypical PIKK PI3K protein kinase [Paratrimastix pyriformis]